MTLQKPASAFILSLLTSPFLLATDIPLTNWTTPPYRSSAARGGISTLADVTPGIGFVGVTPCRIVDTRAVAGFPAGYGPPSMSAGAPRNFDLNSSGLCTGIPAGVEAYSLNITVTSTLGAGFILIYPQGGAQPPVSTLNYLAGQTVANAAIVPAGTNGGVTVIAGVSGTDLIIDINGYFTDDYNVGNRFAAIGTCSACAMVLGDNDSPTAGSHAVGGFAGGAGRVYGVQGQIGAGTASSSAGVRGIASQSGTINYGGDFENSSTTNFTAGVLGNGNGATGENFGVFGDNDSSSNCAAGVFGRSGSQIECHHAGNVGVLGTNTANYGVLGVSGVRGVQGTRVDPVTGNILTAGVLGYSGNSGVHSFQDVTAGGQKPFVVPYPGDARRQVVFVAAEADEALTMTRGRGRFERGLARIQFPEHFQLVTETDGLSLQVTPIGDMATVAVISLDLEGGALLKASRNVEFFYAAYGVRRGYARFTPVQQNVLFVPPNAQETIPPWPDFTKRVLIQNGIYREDGKPNLETAHRMGWDAKWADDEARVRQQQEADREAARLGLPEGTVPPRLPD